MADQMVLREEVMACRLTDGRPYQIFLFKSNQVLIPNAKVTSVD